MWLQLGLIHCSHFALSTFKISFILNSSFRIMSKKSKTVCFSDPPPEEHDPTGRTNYQKVCEKLGVIPVSYFSRHLTDTEITMRFHGLGANGTAAIAKGLKVILSATISCLTTYMYSRKMFIVIPFELISCFIPLVGQRHIGEAEPVW